MIVSRLLIFGSSMESSLNDVMSLGCCCGSVVFSILLVDSFLVLVFGGLDWESVVDSESLVLFRAFCRWRIVFPENCLKADSSSDESLSLVCC